MKDDGSGLKENMSVWGSWVETEVKEHRLATVTPAPYAVVTMWSVWPRNPGIVTDQLIKGGGGERSGPLRRKVARV
jgi:hypothetical protein